MRFILLMLLCILLILIGSALFVNSNTPALHESFACTCSDCEFLQQRNRDWESRISTYATELNNCKADYDSEKQQCQNTLKAQQQQCTTDLNNTKTNYETFIQNLISEKNTIDNNYKTQLNAITTNYNNLITKMNDAVQKQKQMDQHTNQANDVSKQLGT